MHACIRPNTWVVLQLPSGILRPIELVPNATITLGKLGSFLSNSLLGRPYHLTFEIQDKPAAAAYSDLRIVTATELQAEALLTEADALDDTAGTPQEADVVADADVAKPDANGKPTPLRNNQFTVDDASRQSLSMAEIDALKSADATDSGRAIVAKVIASHLALDEKTSFSLAKYTLRKEKKYLRRFIVRPLDPAMLTPYMLEKEQSRILDVREEVLALITAWSNAFYGGGRQEVSNADGSGLVGGGRWLVIDETYGLVVAALAEKMGILYPDEDDEDDIEDHAGMSNGVPLAEPSQATQTAQASEEASGNTARTTTASRPPKKPPAQSMTANQNTITVLHTTAQPNIGFLKYFGFDITAHPGEHPHPLHSHLHALSWLQLLEPSADSTYNTPIETIDPAELASMKSNKRGAYYHKKRRWERVTRVVDLTRAGGFDGLVVATSGTSENGTAIELADIFRHCVPLLRGGAQVVVYSPYADPIMHLTDLYSKDRRSAWLTMLQLQEQALSEQNAAAGEVEADAEEGPIEGTPDFPVNPSLLLAPSMQAVRAREWQALPGRMHPLMTEQGGADGFVFTATRVLPADGKVAARGTYTKRRKVDSSKEVAPRNGGKIDTQKT